jgi:hypothetical protein
MVRRCCSLEAMSDTRRRHRFSVTAGDHTYVLRSFVAGATLEEMGSANLVGIRFLICRSADQLN